MASLLDEAVANVRRKRRRTVRRWLERHSVVRVTARGGRWAWRRRRRAAAGLRWAAQHGFRPVEATAVQCAHCGRSIPMRKVQAHLDKHNAIPTRSGTVAGSPERKTPADTGRTAGQPQPPRRTGPPPAPTGPATPTAVPNPGRTTVATQETTALTRTARVIGQMDPVTAWDLDAQLAGMATAMLALAENVGQWIEHLDAIKTDPRVTGTAANAIAELAEVSGTFSRTRRTFRTLYAAQFEAAETNVRQIRRNDFWNPRAA